MTAGIAVDTVKPTMREYRGRELTGQLTGFEIQEKQVVEPGYSGKVRHLVDHIAVRNKLLKFVIRA